MSTTDNPGIDADNKEVETVLTWRVHPAAYQPRKAILVTVIVVGLALVSGWYAGWLLGVLAVLLLGGSLWPFFLPTTYVVTDSGIRQIRWPTKRYLAWTYFRRFDVDRRGLLLSPFQSPSRLDSFRGMYVLREPADNRVVDVIQQQMGVPPYRNEA